MSDHRGKAEERGKAVGRLKILHVSRRFDGDGGIQHYVQDVQRAQSASGHHVDVLCVGYHHGLRVRKQPMGNGTRYELPELFTVASSGTVSLRVDFLPRLVRGYDVVHLHYPNPLGDAYGAFFGGRLPMPTVATFHGEVADSKPLSGPYQAMTKRFLGNMDRVVVTSPNMLDSSAVLAPFGERCRVAPLGIDPPAPAAAEQQDRLAARWPQPRLLFVGRLTRYKGVEVLLEAMTRAPGHLMVVGRGELQAQLEGRARELGVADRVRFCGFVPENEVAAYFQLADVLVLPSIDRGEGFGYVLLEAMAHQTALVTTELGTGTSYANVGGLTGLVVAPRDWKALAVAIESLTSDPAMLQRCQQAAFRRYEELFTLNAMVAKVGDVYSECRSLTPRRGAQ